jgi:hypothetical protein
MELAAPTRKIGFAVAAFVAIAGALALVLYAAFPYLYAESGSAGYAREHRGEALLALLGALVLSWTAWQCIRRSFALRWWGALVGVIVVTGWIRSTAEEQRPPEGASPVGGNWHVVSTDEPREFWKVRHHLYYKHASRYESIEDLAAEYVFVEPDCVIYRPITLEITYAMCGFRSPASNRGNTSMTESELLERASARPPYRRDWQRNPAQ